MLALESYLRDQDSKFACVTLPYYDVQTAYVRQAAGQCNNLYQCSSILQEIGGNKAQNKEVWITQNGQSAVGFPVTGAPLNAECDDNNVCGYTVRSDMTTKPVPSGAGFTSFLSVVTSSDDYADFLEGIQFESTTKCTTLSGAPWPPLPRPVTPSSTRGTLLSTCTCTCITCATSGCL